MGIASRGLASSATPWRSDRLIRIRDRALALGFDAVGFCRPNSATKHARGWQNSSPPASTATWAGSPTAAMQRSHPRSAVAGGAQRHRLGLSYAPERDPLATLAQRDRGTISVYARNRDYHDVVKGMLKHLAQFIVARHRRAGESVRRYGAGDGEAAGRTRRDRLAGQAHQPRFAHAWLVAVPRRDLHHARPAARRAACRSLRHLHAVPGQSARPTRSRRRTGSMRRAASPT